jgi:hypothetical protein
MVDNLTAIFEPTVFYVSFSTVACVRYHENVFNKPLRCNGRLQNVTHVGGSEYHGATEQQQATVKTPAKLSAYQIPSGNCRICSSNL